jgi:hypothetical protein
VSSACGEFGLYAETTSAAIYLLNCFSGPLEPIPTVTIAAGSVVRIAGSAAGSEGLTLPQRQDIARLDGETITGLTPGKVIVAAAGIDCSLTGASQAASCPLFMVQVR